MANLDRKLAGSNWQNAQTQKQIDSKKVNGNLKKPINNRKNTPPITTFVAMDCEMVGIGENGTGDMLARVSIVDQNCVVLMDKFVKAQEEVTDYRTDVSGIRPKNMEVGEEFEKVQNEVIEILQNKILVGHSIHNDLAVLYIKHPHKLIRDTARYKPLAKLVSNGATPSLKRLSKAILGMEIQTGEHNSVEDAQAAMKIYNRFSADWEKYLKKQNHRHQYHHRHSRNS